MLRKSFARSRRIGRKREIQQILHTGKRVQCQGFVAAYRRNGQQHDRYAFLVGRRHGNAVQRNRIKRVLREVVRLSTTPRPPFHDVLILPGRSAGATYWQHAEGYTEWRNSLSS